MNYRVLLLEDDIGLIDGLTWSLQKNGYEPEVARTVSEALALISQNTYDLLLLDVSLPDGTGFAVCEQVRKSSNVPIIFLTAADEEVNVIRGLDSGGDDYITKPFKIGELCSRIRALLRRFGSADDPGYVTRPSQDRFMQDQDNTRILRDGVPLDLTITEYRLLSLFIRNAGLVLTRDKILHDLWDVEGDFVDDNTLSVYIRRLREKIEVNPSGPEHLLTVRGFGYQWKTAAGEDPENAENRDSHS